MALPAAAAAVAAVLLIAAPPADAQKFPVSGTVFTGCPAYEPTCDDGVPYATLYAMVYTEEGWAKVAEFLTDGTGGFALEFDVRYIWQVRAYKWNQRNACLWDLYGGRSLPFEHNPYRPFGLVLQIPASYIKSQRTCSEEGPADPGAGAAPPADPTPPSKACVFARNRAKRLGGKVRRLRARVRRGHRWSRRPLRKARRQLRRTRRQVSRRC